MALLMLQPRPTRCSFGAFWTVLIIRALCCPAGKGNKNFIKIFDITIASVACTANAVTSFRQKTGSENLENGTLTGRGPEVSKGIAGGPHAHSSALVRHADAHLSASLCKTRGKITCQPRQSFGKRRTQDANDARLLGGVGPSAGAQGIATY